MASHLPELDGLRGLAAAAVLVAHGANAGLLPEMLGGGFGQAGVALFYALSGFLMAHVNFGRGFEGRSITRYLAARAARILPLYFVAAGLAAAAFFTVGFPFYDFTEPREIALSLLLLRGESVLWSIPVEVHFYLLFVPLWFAHSRGLLPTALLALGLPAFAFAFWTGETGRDTHFLPYWLHFFLIGIAIRYLFGRGRLTLDARAGPKGAAGTAAATGVVLLLLLPPGLRHELGMGDFRNYVDPVVIAAVPLFLWCCYERAGAFRLLAARPMVWLGRVSLSLYLLHAPIIQVVLGLEIGASWPPVSRFAAVAIVAGLLSEVSYRLIERPGQRILRRGGPSGESERAAGHRVDLAW